jgi:hypothetical protein
LDGNVRGVKCEARSGVGENEKQDSAKLHEEVRKKIGRSAFGIVKGNSFAKTEDGDNLYTNNQLRIAKHMTMVRRRESFKSVVVGYEKLNARGRNGDLGVDYNKVTSPAPT